MPKNNLKVRGIERWTMPERGVTVEDTAQVTLEREALQPAICFRGGMKVAGQRDYLVVAPLGSAWRAITVTFGPPLLITTGCFTGTLDEFRAEVALKPRDRAKREYEALVRFILEVADARGFLDGEGAPESGLGEADW